MRLRELEPAFLKRNDDASHQRVDEINGADGIIFLCPVCFQSNKGSVGTHSVICWQPHVPQTTSPTPGRWNFLGTGYDDLTLQNGSSSILLTSGCNAHFWITNGEIKF